MGVLVGYLPPESATATALRLAAAEAGTPAGNPDDNPSEGQWSLTNMLVASLIDEIRFLRYEYRQVNSEQPGQAPQPVPRPGVAGKKRARYTLEQAMLLDPRMRGGQDG